jgi:hypothetical protein
VGLPWPWAGTVQKLESGLVFNLLFSERNGSFGHFRYSGIEVMRGQVTDFANSVNRKTELRAEKNLHLCRAGAFENPLFSTGASHSGFGSHSRVGLQAPNVCWLPAGTPSVRQKDRRLTNTAEVMEAVADFHE